MQTCFPEQFRSPQIGELRQSQVEAMRDYFNPAESAKFHNDKAGWYAVDGDTIPVASLFLEKVFQIQALVEALAHIIGHNHRS